MSPTSTATTDLVSLPASVVSGATGIAFVVCEYGTGGGAVAAFYYKETPFTVTQSALESSVFSTEQFYGASPNGVVKVSSGASAVSAVIVP
jgi:hypothetical protein